MTTINLTHIRGDSKTLAFTVLDENVAPVDLAFLKARKGDILVPAGGSAPNQKPIVIMEVTDNTNLVTDYSDWATEAGVSFTIKVADVKTPGQGDFTLTFDVVR